MLVLSRKPGESIVVGSQIEITIVEIRGNRIRLAIKAPRELSVQRGELRQLIQEELEDRHESADEIEQCPAA
ncbi:MAG: carbon storage regulator CsrA [Planctomycetota bacterium]|nr:carbon storage regulator CsrA [Planctomycetota bacterium]MDA1215106.1 carbon storage regulator CsrA [Planctomycetota bacterium]